MIRMHGLSLRVGRTLLLEGADLVISRGAKVGLVGRNGSGKTSLFSLLLGELSQDSGDLMLASRISISHVAQEVAALERPAIEYVIDGDRELRNVESGIEQAQRRNAGRTLGELHAKFDALDGYTAASRAARLLTGLGFDECSHTQNVNEFSGGWRMRLNLAQALMCRSDLLLLDEPTNHLDLDAVLWLERWIRSYDGTLLLIAHDREFLDNIVDHVAHLDGKKVQLYRGNYSSFEHQHVANAARHQALYTKQQRDIQRMRGFVDRFRAKASKAKQAQSRLKALARMEVIAAAHVNTPFDFQFPVPAKNPNPLLKIEDVKLGYGDDVVLDDVNLLIQPGLRVGLVGVNGAGKSTLIKYLAGELEAKSGDRGDGVGLKVGYFAQHQLEGLDPTASAIVHLHRIDRDVPEQRFKDFLGGFDFGGERASIPTGTFSGGEKARLALALTVWHAPNLLLLDEPTNHLDMDMRHALTVALQTYVGALILVSHDAHLIRTVTDELWMVGEGRVDIYNGDLDDYRRWSAGDRTEPSEMPLEVVHTEKPNDTSDKKRQRQDRAEQRLVRQPLVSRANRLEKTMSRLTRECTQLDALLADSSIYEDARKDELRDTSFARARLGDQLSSAEAEWLEIQEQLTRFDTG